MLALDELREFIVPSVPNTSKDTDAALADAAKKRKKKLKIKTKKGVVFLNFFL